MARKTLIVKEDGTQEYFDVAKLRLSLSRAGAPGREIDDIVRHVSAAIKDGDSTKSIYRHAFAHLKKSVRPAAARYSMKRAVLALGPSGFPFEKFIAEIFTALGYRAKTGVVLAGKCVEHEVDVIAEGSERRIGVEAKFHNDLGLKSDVKVALYVKARFDDLAAAGKPQYFDERWLVTNTKFTEQATLYGRCAGISLVSWEYPKQRNLNHLIEEAGVHPVTCLTTLSRKEKDTLLSRSIVLCRDIMRDRNTLASAGLSGTKIDGVIAEARALCGSGVRVQ